MIYSRFSPQRTETGGPAEPKHRPSHPDITRKGCLRSSGWGPDPLALDRLGYSQKFSARSRQPLSFDFLLTMTTAPFSFFFNRPLVPTLTVAHGADDSGWRTYAKQSRTCSVFHPSPPLTQPRAALPHPQFSGPTGSAFDTP